MAPMVSCAWHLAFDQAWTHAIESPCILNGEELQTECAQDRHERHGVGTTDVLGALPSPEAAREQIANRSRC